MTQQKTIRVSKAGYKIILHLAALITGCFYFTGCENDPKMIDEWSKKKILVEEGRGIESYLSQEGKLKAKLVAPVMLRYQADTIHVDFPNALHVDFYEDSSANGQNPKIETWLDAKHGKYFETLNKVYLWDSVVVINVKGDTLKSQDLWWDQNAKLFYTDKYAEYRTIDKQIYPGKGLEATQDFSRITFKYPIGRVKYSDTTLSR